MAQGTANGKAACFEDSAPTTLPHSSPRAGQWGAGVSEAVDGVGRSSPRLHRLTRALAHSLSWNLLLLFDLNMGKCHRLTLRETMTGLGPQVTRAFGGQCPPTDCQLAPGPLTTFVWVASEKTPDERTQGIIAKSMPFMNVPFTSPKIIKPAIKTVRWP